MLITTALVQKNDVALLPGTVTVLIFPFPFFLYWLIVLVAILPHMQSETPYWVLCVVIQREVSFLELESFADM